MSLIAGELFPTPAVSPWHGTAAELEMRLTGADSRCTQEARKLFSWPTACGRFLGRLARRMPERVIYDRREDSSHFQSKMVALVARHPESKQFGI